jgi:hypothetical protein
VLSASLEVVAPLGPAHYWPPSHGTDQSSLCWDTSSLCQYAYRLTVGPPALDQTKSYSVQPCLLLAATISPEGRSRVFFYWVRPASLMVGPDYTAPSCPTATVWDSTIYPNSWSPSSLAWVQRMQPGLRPNLHVGWPLDLRPSAITILQYAASLAAGGYDWPCRPIKILFWLKPTLYAW